MEKPSYYAVIPAEVRYDENLSPNAKLLFAEITCLCNKNGVCNASNKYFSSLYGVSTVSISKWISQLISREYIKTNMIYHDGSKEIKSREIVLLISAEVLKEDDKEVVEDINFDSLLKWFNKLTGKSSRSVSDKVKKQFRARIKEGYNKSDITRAIKNCFEDDYHKANPKYLTLEFISRPDKFEKYVGASSSNVSSEDLAMKKRIELKKSMGI